MANAVSLALAPNMALAQSRRGHLSIWKGCAGANASRNAVFAATLAKEGFTGPTAVFEGNGGLWDAIGRFEWPLPEHGEMIPLTHTKSLPVCYHGQSAVLAAIKLRERVDVAKIEDVQVDTYRAGLMMMGNEPSRWAPDTRETADHSLPYLLALGFVDGRIGPESFSDERIRDPALRALMQRIRVAENKDYTREFPGKLMTRIEVTTRGGERVSALASYPKGHAKNPMSDADVEAKFADLSHELLPAGRRTTLLQALWNVERAANIGAVLELSSVA
jgi:2-methylcitrate dehydratase